MAEMCSLRADVVVVLQMLVVMSLAWPLEASEMPKHTRVEFWEVSGAVVL